MEARHEVLIENYVKVVNIEALTMLDMAKKDLLPAMSEYVTELACAIKERKSVAPETDVTYERETLEELSRLVAATYGSVRKLEKDLSETKKIASDEERADYYKSTIISDMDGLRESVDAAETITPTKYWPYPGYGELLFGVR